MHWQCLCPVRCDVHQSTSIHVVSAPLSMNGGFKTDALRRHQKSRYETPLSSINRSQQLSVFFIRHNGVVLEPRGATKGAQDTNDEASGSRSSSRSASPSGSNVDPEDDPKSPQTPATQPEQPPAGPSSYYRPHTMHSSRMRAARNFEPCLLFDLTSFDSLSSAACIYGHTLSPTHWLANFCSTFRTPAMASWSCLA